MYLPYGECISVLSCDPEQLGAPGQPEDLVSPWCVVEAGDVVKCVNPKPMYCIEVRNRSFLTKVAGIAHWD